MEEYSAFFGRATRQQMAPIASFELNTGNVQAIHGIPTVGIRSSGFGSPLIALTSFYWALGGQTGMGTIAANPDDIDLITEPVVVFLSGAAKILAGLLALAQARAWGGPRLVRWLRNLTLVGGVLMLLYGTALLVQHFLCGCP